jgi:ABC-type nickel/cobalt efflux system permease component RcnA
MQPLLGLGLLLIALIAMYFFVRGWDGLRAQFGAHLQGLFARDTPPALDAARTAQPKQHHRSAVPAHRHAAAKPPHVAPARGSANNRHLPTARHH